MTAASSTPTSPGTRFRQALRTERPLQLPGVINAYAALLAQRAGFRALYISGAGVANASFGLPDLALTTLGEVCEELRRVTGVCDLPVIVDADTAWGGAFMIARTIRELARAGAAGCHIEDQVQAKRCGHRPGKRLVSAQEMCDRIKAAVDARDDAEFALIARTDAYGIEGRSAAVDRAARYIDAGADIIFAEALKSLDDFRHFATTLPVPVLANMTEFGATPILSRSELADAGTAIALYPLTAFRAMSAAATQAYQRLRADGDQRGLLTGLQTRAELYEVLRYHDYEHELDRLFGVSRDETTE